MFFFISDLLIILDNKSISRNIIINRNNITPIILMLVAYPQQIPKIKKSQGFSFSNAIWLQANVIVNMHKNGISLVL